MTKEEMLRFYANKIVEDGIRNSLECSIIVPLTNYNTNGIKLENYKSEILQLLYRDERISDVVIDDELNIDMVFYTDYCPFYYYEESNIQNNEFLNSLVYQSIMLVHFIDFIKNHIIQKSFISIRNLINDFAETAQMNNKNKEILSNFLKKSIIQTGFIDKYLDNINVYVTHKNYKELESGILKMIEQKNKDIKNFSAETIKESEEFE